MKKITLLTIVLFSVISYAQVGINTNTPDSSSALDIESTTGGILIPRLTETQRDAISSPATGLMVYQTDQTTGFYFYNGIAWTRIEGVAGPQGEQGLQGVAGNDGADGTNGVDGSNGSSAYEIWIAAGNTGTEAEFLASLVGAQGETGAQGPAGADGEDGAQGPIGNTGPAGAQGDQGLQGIQGETGATGAAGPQGEQGIQGETGAQGDQGLQGIQGETGATGGVGPQGPQGIQGLAGADGINGTNGSDGSSAYQIWTDAGNTGSEQDFIDSLTGPQGPQGETGATGPAGPQGPQGEQGIQGETGAQGDQGLQGIQGETGATGATNLGSVPYLSSSEIGNLSPQNGNLVFDYETSRLLIYVSALSGYNFDYMNYNFRDAVWNTCSTSAQYHMTFQVQVPCAIENIKSRDSGNSNTNHNSSCSIELLLDDDDDLSNGNLGNYEGRVLEVGKYVHLRFPGCSNSGGCYYFYNEAPYDNNSFGTISNYLNYVSNSSYFFDFRYDLSALSSGWNIIIDYGD